MRLTATSWLMSGRPAQFIEMRENSRCSIWFHLLVPGGMCTTVIAMQSSPASPASSTYPQPQPVPVGAAGVGGDQQFLRIRVGVFADGVPPAAAGHHGERGGVAVRADRYPVRVGADVIHPVGTTLPSCLSRKSW